MSLRLSRGTGVTIRAIAALFLMSAGACGVAAEHSAASKRDATSVQAAVGLEISAADNDNPHALALGSSGGLRPTPKPVWTAGESAERACFRSRRKLWQAGEGWMVKRVNVCP